MTSNGKRRAFLDRVAQLEEMVSALPELEPIEVTPWIHIVDVRKFLAHARQEAEALAGDKPPIGYPVTNAVWEDFVNAFERLEATVAKRNGNSLVRS